jgi:hypothetical protein
MLKNFYFPLFFTVLVISCSSKKEENTQAPPVQVNEYPNLTLTLRDGGHISTKTLKGKNIFVLFQPDCDHCQREATEIEQRLDRFKAYTLYFISSAPMDQILKFATAYKLIDRSKVVFAWTPTEAVLNYYGSIPTPSIYIYSDGSLMRSFNGQTDVETILNSL